MIALSLWGIFPLLPPVPRHTPVIARPPIEHARVYRTAPDLRGQTFGDVLVLDRAVPGVDRSGASLWRVQCRVCCAYRTERGKYLKTGDATAHGKRCQTGGVTP